MDTQLARIRACPVSQVPFGRTWFCGPAIGGYLVPFFNNSDTLQWAWPAEPFLVDLIACPTTDDKALSVMVEVSPGRCAWFDMRNWKGGPDEAVSWTPPPPEYSFFGLSDAVGIKR